MYSMVSEDRFTMVDFQDDTPETDIQDDQDEEYNPYNGGTHGTWYKGELVDTSYFSDDVDNHDNW